MVHFRSADSLDATALNDPDADGILVDSRTATAVGGTGIAFDWDAARKGLFGNAGALKLIAAGGLSPQNVAEAIAKLQPWGVDVVSGVELSPGAKTLRKCVHSLPMRALRIARSEKIETELAIYTNTCIIQS